MTPIEATWGDVELDDYICDRDGVIWRICAADPEAASSSEETPAFRCRNQENEWLTIKPKPRTGAVIKMLREDGDEHLVAMLRDTLGAEVIASKPHGGEWACDPWPTDKSGGSLVPFRNHLEVVHGMYAGDIKTFKQLLEAHEAAHDPAEPYVGKSIPHNHTRRP